MDDVSRCFCTEYRGGSAVGAKTPRVTSEAEVPQAEIAGEWPGQERDFPVQYGAGLESKPRAALRSAVRASTR